MKLTHFDDKGKARMVDVTKKAVTQRIAIATGSVVMKPATLRIVREGKRRRATCSAWPVWRESWRQKTLPI